MLFAQVGGRFGGGGQNFGGGRPNSEMSPEAMMVIFVIAFIFIAIALTVHILYLLSLSKCFSRIAPRNRRMEPGMVWLNLVPCLNIVWIFITTTRLADSLRDEFADRGLRGDGDFGRSLGITYPILNLLGAIPYIGMLFGIGGLICWIVYWVKIAGYSRQLLEDGAHRSRDRAFDDYSDRSASRNYEDDDFYRERR
jgi:hypothetical protein